MSFLLDTDLVSLTQKNFLPAKLETWLIEHEHESFISVVSIAEMRHGLECAPESHQPALAAKVNGTETHCAAAIEPVTVETLLEWKRVFAHLKKTKLTMTCEDSLLAAQCLQLGHAIVTNNTKHFHPVKALGLKIVNPLAD